MLDSDFCEFVAVFAVFHGPAFSGEFVAEFVGGDPVFVGASGPAGIGESLDVCGDFCGFFRNVRQGDAEGF